MTETKTKILPVLNYRKKQAENWKRVVFTGKELKEARITDLDIVVCDSCNELIKDNQEIYVNYYNGLCLECAKNEKKLTQ